MWPFSKKQQHISHPSGQGNTFGSHQPQPYQPSPSSFPLPQQQPQALPSSPYQAQQPWYEEQPVFEGQLAVDVYQTDSDIVIKAPVAGVEPEEIDITITEDVITIKGERKDDHLIPAEAYFTQECYYGTFSRSIILPVPVIADQADATFKNGVLQIVIPKADKVRTKVLKVKTD